MYLIEAFQSGGAMMYAILLLGVTAVAISVERVSVLYFRNNLNKDHFYKNLTSHLLNGDLQGMVQVCDQNPAPISRVVKNCMIRLINHGSDEEIQAALDEGAITEVPKVEKRIGFLAVIGNVATLMGLLGTITGLIRSFAAVADADAAAKAAGLTKGISEAMNCTAFGLIVAVPSVILYSIFQSRAQSLIEDINEISIKTFNFICANRERFGVMEKSG
jgi:biopolymer transport protein ExbB